MKFTENTWMRIIAVLEIIGGGVGVLFVVYMSVMSEFAFNVIILMPIFLGIYILSLLAGIKLWERTEFGRKASIVTQFIQLPKLVSPAFTFMFSFGFDLFPHITFVNNLSTMGIQFRLFSDGQMFLNTQAPLMLGFSLTSIFALIQLWNYDPNAVEEKASEGDDGPPGPEEYFLDNK